MGRRGKTHIDVCGVIVLTMKGKIVVAFKKKLDKTSSTWKATLYILTETHKPSQVNFGRGGLKKIMDEADASHAEAIHYAASASIRVGKENLGMI